MTVRLIECRRGDRVRIVRIEAGRGAILNLINLGLNVSHTIELLQRSPLRGPLLVAHRGTAVAIGYQLAERILVEKD
ncbi:MAG: ferrous iron transport protein A [Polyangiaceae bacterium]|nr:ferrous iron transport protein A [Polyangiaceae bacterium]